MNHAETEGRGVASCDHPVGSEIGKRPSIRLLVSVRKATEAHAALHGGCDVLDVKEPARGALGMADLSMIADIVALSRECVSPVPVSVALGDAADWNGDRPLPRLPQGIDYLKLGTAGLNECAAWHMAFGDVKNRLSEANAKFVDTAAESSFGVTGGSLPSWIAVAYADWQIARGPAPEDVIATAHASGCAGVLIDTFSKGRLRLLDWLDCSRLKSLAAQARSQKLTFALAGRLQIGDLPQVLAACPDTVGIRSAACRDGVRSGEIDARAVHAFREALCRR